MIMINVWFGPNVDRNDEYKVNHPRFLSDMGPLL